MGNINKNVPITIMKRKLKMNNCAGFTIVRLKLRFNAENSLRNTAAVAKYNQNEFCKNMGNSMDVIPQYCIIMHKSRTSKIRSKGRDFNLGRVAFRIYLPIKEKHPAMIVTI